ncbi:MAG TPA: VIT1/CCC1 transporter family protein [Chloroflexia bacterium]|nr:VIT1/CCC1 transporter family protein [Chloroflexia bacterium]
MEELNETTETELSRSKSGILHYPSFKLRQHLLEEKARIERLGRIRQIVFGSLDGLLVPLGVVSGVAGGTGNARAVIVAGLAEAFAGALSMGAGEFVSGKSEAQVQKAEVEAEQERIRQNPQYEFNEFVAILQEEGVKAEDATVIAQRLQNNPRAYAKTMVEKEFGIDPTPRAGMIEEGFTMGISYIVASIIPLIAYFFFPVGTAFFISLGLSFVFLVVLGLFRGKMARTNLLVSALEIVVIGTISGLGGYLLGNILPNLLGF